MIRGGLEVLRLTLGVKPGEIFVKPEEIFKFIWSHRFQNLSNQDNVYIGANGSLSWKALHHALVDWFVDFFQLSLYSDAKWWRQKTTFELFCTPFFQMPRVILKTFEPPLAWHFLVSTKNLLCITFATFFVVVVVHQTSQIIYYLHVCSRMFDKDVHRFENSCANEFRELAGTNELRRWHWILNTIKIQWIEYAIDCKWQCSHQDIDQHWMQSAHITTPEMLLDTSLHC